MAETRVLPESVERIVTEGHPEHVQRCIGCDRLRAAILAALASERERGYEFGRQQMAREAAVLAENTTELERGCLDVPDAIRALVQPECAHPNPIEVFWGNKREPGLYCEICECKVSARQADDRIMVREQGGQVIGMAKDPRQADGE